MALLSAEDNDRMRACSAEVRLASLLSAPSTAHPLVWDPQMSRPSR